MPFAQNLKLPVPARAGTVMSLVLATVLFCAPAWADGVVANCNETELAAKLAAGGNITFLCSGTITLSATLTIATSTTLNGLGQTITISGNNAVRVFFVNPGISFSLNNLTIANGKTADSGGGIYSLGAVTVTNSTFSGNAALNGGNGGGIWSETGSLAVSNSTFVGNTATSGGNGGALGGESLTIVNSTFIGNSASISGGAVVARSAFPISTITQSTFVGNSASGGSAIASFTVSLKNSIFAGSSGGEECVGAVTDDGYNLSDDASCSFSQVTSATVPLASLRLGSLASNGGATQTLMLGVDSTAVDRIPNGANDCGGSIASDQRGKSRPQNSACDVGALELVRNVVGNGSAPSCTPDALAAAVTAPGDMVTFNCPNPTTITLTQSLTIGASVPVIDGIGQNITLSGGGKIPVIVVNANSTLALKSLKISGGSGAVNNGGGVSNSGQLTVIDSTFSANTAPTGAGILNAGSLTVTRTTFSNNAASAGGGGAVFNSGTAVVADSTLDGNSAGAGGGGIYNSATGMLTVTNTTLSGNSSIGSGGGIHNAGGTLTVSASTFSANSLRGSGAFGAAIFNTGMASITRTTLSTNAAGSGGGGGVFNSGTAVVANSTLDGNSAGAGGGGIYNSAAGTLTVTNATMSGNSSTSSGRGIYNAGTATLSSTLLAGAAGGECGGTVIDGGYNLADDGTCSFSAGTHSQVVSVDSLKLGARGSNGGATQTIALGKGSVAIDVIPIGTPGCAGATDQRGAARPWNNQCDVGAYEASVVGTGTASSCTGAALSAAVAVGGPIAFDCGGSATILLSGTVSISADVSLDGADQSIILSGGGQFTVLSILHGTTSLSSLTIANGSGSIAGGIHNNGTLNITNSAFASNRAYAMNTGGAIYNTGTLTINNSTFFSNTAEDYGSAAAIFNLGASTLTNSTFFSNRAKQSLSSGAIVNEGTMTITNSTFSSNVVENSFFSASAIVAFNTTPIMNSIFAGNTGADDCLGGQSDYGFNLSDDSTCEFDQATSRVFPLASLKLGPPGFYGGPTQTIPLGQGSPAIDAIPNGTNGCGASVTTDQRGILRPQFSMCDIGAFESYIRKRTGQVTSN